MGIESPPGIPPSLDPVEQDFWRWVFAAVFSYPNVASPPAIPAATYYRWLAGILMTGGRFISPPSYPVDSAALPLCRWAVVQVKKLKG